MGHYAPRTVAQLAAVLDDMCRDLELRSGVPIASARRRAMTLRMIELFDSGITDSEQLKLGLAVDGLSAAA